MSKAKKKIKTKLKIYAFIDSQNLHLGVQSQGWKLDFKRFYIYLTDKYKVNKALLFIGFIPKNKDLYNFLKNQATHWSISLSLNQSDMLRQKET